MKSNKFLTKRLALRIVVVLVLSVGASVVVWAAIRRLDPIGDSIPNLQLTDDRDKLENLRRPYAAIKSVHIKAEAQIALYGDNFRVGKGSYEYWAEANRYKVKCHTDERLGLLPDVDLAYNGQRFFHLDRGSGLLVYKNQDIAATIGALPNPLFMPVNFLSPEDDNCRFCALRMIDFKSQIARWSERAALAKVKSQQKDPATGYTLTEIELPGGTKAKRRLNVNVLISEGPEGQMRPTRIAEISSDGKLVTSITFDDFMPTALGQFPRIVVFEGYDDKSNLLIRMTYSIKTLELDQHIDDDVFAISFAEAQKVWDNDAARLVKENPPKAPRH